MLKNIWILIFSILYAISNSILALVDDVSAAIRRLHSYTVPETIAIDIMGGSESYMKWVRDSTKMNELSK